MSWKITLRYSILCVLLVFPASSSKNEEATYDFIVVGGGTSGCAVASRLSEDGRYSVLLLERGPNQPDSVLVPALSKTSVYNYNIVRAYPTVPQKYAGLKQNGIIQFVTGNVLGGGSSINAMWFNRGSPHSYDNWARIAGDNSWRYSNLLRLFKKMETYQGMFPSDQHGYTGPITVRRPTFAPSMNELLEAGKFLGFQVADPSGPQRVSFAPAEFSLRSGRRVTSFEAYIRPFLGQRRNLNVFTNSEVTKILLEGTRATGVEYITAASGQTKIVHARKEVIISAGVVNSPVILQRSGIGPGEILKAAGIKVVKDLPVGKNAHDHLIVIHRFIMKNTSDVFSAQKDLTCDSFQYYKDFGDGPFTTYGAADVQAFYASSKVPLSYRKHLGWADIQLVFLQTTDPLPIPGLPPLSPNDISEGEVATAGFVFLNRPQSRGSIQINTTHPEADPLIDFQYLKESQDVEVTMEGLKLLFKVYEDTPQFQSHGARLPATPLQECAHLPFKSDDYWRCYIRQMSVAGLHAAGSVRMGHGPKDAVVDSKLKVIGIQNLRVADCSVMPEIINADPQAAAYVIAEKVAEDILQEWETKGQPPHPPNHSKL